MNLREINKKVSDLEERMGLHTVYEITDENLKKTMWEIAKMHASKVDELTKHIALYGYLFLKLLQDKDLRGYKLVTQMRYYFLQKALEKRFEPLTGEEAFSIVETWQRNKGDEDELTHQIRDQISHEHFEKRRRELEEEPHSEEEEEEEDIDEP